MLTRRTFLEGTASAILISEIIKLEDLFLSDSKTNQDRQKIKLENWFKNKMDQASRVIKNESERQSFLTTVLQSVLVFLAEAMLYKIRDDLKLNKDGMLSRSELVDLERNLISGVDAKGMFKMYFDQMVRVPFFETILFQYLPSLIISLGLGKGQHWEVGFPITLVFSLAHNINKDKEGKYKFDTDFIPWPQFLQGLFYWYLIREVGPISTLLAHSSHNVVNVSDLLLDIFPKK